MCVCVCECVCGGESRGLPTDRRGACCFLLGMLLQDFPLDFSCRDQNSGRAGEGNRCDGRGGGGKKKIRVKVC